MLFLVLEFMTSWSQGNNFTAAGSPSEWLDPWSKLVNSFVLMDWSISFNFESLWVFIRSRDGDFIQIGIPAIPASSVGWCIAVQLKSASQTSFSKIHVTYFKFCTLSVIVICVVSTWQVLAFSYVSKTVFHLMEVFLRHCYLCFFFHQPHDENKHLISLLQCAFCFFSHFWINREPSVIFSNCPRYRCHQRRPTPTCRFGPCVWSSVIALSWKVGNQPVFVERYSVSRRQAAQEGILS
jgi:hypothetical protein